MVIKHANTRHTQLVMCSVHFSLLTSILLLIVPWYSVIHIHTTMLTTSVMSLLKERILLAYLLYMSPKMFARSVQMLVENFQGNICLMYDHTNTLTICRLTSRWKDIMLILILLHNFSLIRTSSTERASKLSTPLVWPEQVAWFSIRRMWQTLPFKHISVTITISHIK